MRAPADSRRTFHQSFWVIHTNIKHACRCTEELQAVAQNSQGHEGNLAAAIRRLIEEVEAVAITRALDLLQLPPRPVCRACMLLALTP